MLYIYIYYIYVYIYIYICLYKYIYIYIYIMVVRILQPNMTVTKLRSLPKISSYFGTRFGRNIYFKCR